MHAPGEADLNLYAYVSGSVLKNVDPLGLLEKAAQSSAPVEAVQSNPDGTVTNSDGTKSANESEQAEANYQDTAARAERTKAEHKKIDKAVAEGDARTEAARKEALAAGARIGLIEGAWTDGTPGEHEAIIESAAARCGEACKSHREAFELGVTAGRLAAGALQAAAGYAAGAVTARSTAKPVPPKPAPGPGSDVPRVDNSASPATSVGRRGQQVHFPNPNEPVPRNTPGVVNGREYSGHAFDRMQERGFTPTVVENAITTGRVEPGDRPGTSQIFDDANGFSVIVNSASGRVITVY